MNLGHIIIFLVYSSLLMHRPKIVAESGSSYLTPMLSKKYFEKPLSIFNRHLNCSYNRATTIYTLMTSWSLSFFSKVHFLVWCLRLPSIQQQYRVFSWSRFSSIVILSITKWLTMECFSLTHARPSACFLSCVDLLFYDSVI